MNKIKLVQTFLLSIIAFGIVGILAQNQIIIRQLSQQKTETPLVRQASYRQGQNFVTMPVNPDGSIDVNIKSASDVVDVNIKSSDSWSLQWAFGTYPIPVKVKD